MRRLLIETAPNYDEGPRGCAGTDTPWYEDGEGFEISGEYDDSDAYPFGYFPVDPKTNELGFFISNDNAIIHNELFGQALEEYISRLILETFEPVDAQLGEKMNEFHDFVRQNGLIKRDKTIGFTVVSVFENENGDNRIIFKDVVARIFNELGIKIPVDDYLAMVVHEIFVKANWNLYNFSYEFNEYIYQDFYFYDSSDQELIAKLFGFDINAIFERSRLLGRIWFDTGLITFYPGQQPSRDEMKQVIKDIAENEGRAETEFYGFYTIFEVGSKEPYTGTGYKMHDDATIQCCTVADYIEGKYSGFNREAEIEMVKNRKGIDAFNVHLANQNVKKNFFKNFRNTRDKAVYAPREKAAGSLAAYHAMRYPFGESRKSSGKLLINERYDQAGTDFPSYYDENTGEWYEASWNNDYGFPFGCWPIDDAGNEEFFVGEAYDTHAQACGQAAKIYFDKKISNLAYEDADNIKSALDSLIEYFNDNGFHYDEENDAYVSEESYEVKSADDLVDMIREDFYYEIEYSWELLGELALNWLEEGTEPSYEEIAEQLIEASSNEYSFHERNDIDEALEVVGSDFNTFFEEGHSEGRVWPYANMIGFYETEQPEPYQLMQILHALDEYAGLDVDNLLEYHIVFEDWNNNGAITACTVQDYIDGNYGPNKDEDEEEEEAERQYARDGKTVFVPHLANQQDKFNFFKNFRNTRDKAVYAPREKAAGTLASYHAMRYPYGEEKETKGNLIKEYKRYNEAGTDHPYFKDENTGEIIEADWDDGEGFPFGYFPVKSDGELEFCVADYGETHAQACGVAAKKYFDDVTADMPYDVANEVYYSLTDFFEEFKNDGYTYNPDEDAYFSADGSSKLVWEDFVDKVMENIYSEFGDTYTVVVELVRDFLENGTEPSFEQVQEVLLHNVEDYEFYEKDDIDRALEVIGSNFDDFFEDGRLEGRIWPEKGLISFYFTEQPNPQELEDVIYDLADYMGVSYEYFMDFFIIYEDLDDGCIVKMCTVDEYINGPQEPDKQYARDGKTVFVPHLANQKDKFNFFKNFRNTRDKAVYAPREKTAGSLARYHAMRYPYGENRKRLLQIIDEEIKKILKKEPYK